MIKKTSQWNKEKPELAVVENEEPQEEITSATQLPEPKGWRILCALPKNILLWFCM